MTFKDKTIYISTQVLSRQTWKRPRDMFGVLGLFAEMMPELEPDVWGWWEPLDKKWSLEDLSQFIPDDRASMTDTIYWERRRLPKCRGEFRVSWHSANQAVAKDTHASVKVYVPYGATSLKNHLRFLQEASVACEADFAHVHVVAEQEQESRTLEASYGGGRSYPGLEVATHELRHWLPTLPWAAVFGEAYVRLFGLDRLLSAPAYEVRQLADSTVFIQLSPDVDDFLNDYQTVDAVRRKVQEHLGADAFFDPTRAYPLRGPRGQTTLAELRTFKRPEPGRNGFRVPEFRLIPD